MSDLNRRSFLHSSAMVTAGIGAGMAAAWQSVAGGAEVSKAPKLKVTGVKTILLDNIRPYIGHRKWLFVQLFTNEGIVGLGERPTGGVTNLTSQIELLHDLCERFVIGQSPFDIEKIWQNMKTSNHDYSHPGLYAVPAFSAIEMACWDIVGKATHQPIYNLLGGK